MEKNCNEDQDQGAPRRRAGTASSKLAAAYRWAAMGTLVAYSAVGSKTFNVARAQDVQGNGQGNGPISQTQGAQPVRRFEIAAGPLDSVLAAFEQVTGISATVSQEGIRSLSSPGVTGLYTPEQALQKLLADTGRDLPLHFGHRRVAGSEDAWRPRWT